MTTTIPSTDIVVPVEPLFTEAERVALAGFLAGYRGLTGDAYALDLRMFTAWCQQHELHLFQARRADIECFGRELESGGEPRDHRPSALHDLRLLPLRRRGGTARALPAVHVRRARLDYESHAIGLDRNEIGSLRVAAGLGAPNEHALISLLAINGLRISEALGADIDALGLERGHRTLTVLRKGGKIVTIPLAPRTARAIDLAIGERLEGPILLRPDGQRMDRHCASRILRRVAGRAGVDNPIGPTPCATPSSPVPLPDVRAGSRIVRRPAHHRCGRAGRLRTPPRPLLHTTRRHQHNPQILGSVATVTRNHRSRRCQ